MKLTVKAAVGHWLRWLIALVLLIGLTAAPACAEETSLVPDDLEYENGNIILHKHAERIGPDEWKVVVRATVGEQPVEKRKMEVVFLMDISSSMKNNEAHEHTDECNNLECTKTEHVHTDGCYDLDNRTCGKTEHEHTDACYVQDCGKTEHEHTDYTGNCYEQCTRQSNPTHWNRNSHRSNYSCVRGNGNRYYQLVCNEDEHTHSSSCESLICGQDEHEHSSSCAELICEEEVHTHSSSCYGDELACGFTNTSRFGVAVQAAERLIANLPEGTDVTRLAFATNFYNDIDSYYSISTSSGTYMWNGIKNSLQGGYFTEDESKKIFVILTDGETSSRDTNKTTATNLLNDFKDPDGTDGMVFTVGFAYDSDILSSIAGNGGYYMYAENASDLSVAFEKLEQTLTAMLEDPMGTSVGFDKTSIQEIQTSGGVVSSNSDTIFWHPAEDGSDSVRNSTIEYSYTVKLNQLADFSSGLHQVALNNPTYFRYGLKTGQDEPTEMKEAKFPIPTAEYSVSSVQTKWQAGGKDIQTPLAAEHVVCDYASAGYIPAFTQDYQTITPVIPIEGSSDYYRYVGTTVTANGTQVSGVEAVDASKAQDYVVIHQYERVDSNELAVGGTKTLIGRDFKPGDSFTFTLTAVTSGAPMPDSSTVTITPQSGSSMAFSFGSITYDKAGTYTYTIQELDGSLDKVMYDTAPHTLVVTAQEVNREIVVSYTMDGVANGALTVINHLETGALKVEKTGVVSHLSEHQTKEFGFLIYVKDASDRPLNGTYTLQRSDGTTQSLTFTNGYAPVMLRAGEYAVIDGLPDGAAYTVTEDAAGGFTVTSSGDTGVIAADEQREASFANVYHSSGLYQFIGTKQLQDSALALDQFSFSVLDESGQVVATGKNNTDGSIFLNTLYFTEKDIGTRTYTIVEDPGSEPGIIYDRTAYEVTLTIADKGDGTLAVTDDLNGTPILFRNQFIANQFTVTKTVEGDIGSRNKDFPFTISLPDMAGQSVSVSTDGGVTFQSVTLNAQGTMDFTLRHGQSIIFYPVSGAYTVTETDAGGYTTTCAVNQGAAAESRTASGTVGTDGATVAFINTLQAVTPTGVRTSAGSAVAGLCMAACLLAILLARRRCSGLE